MLENVKYLEEALKEFDPVVLDYNKDKVVGFPNDINGHDLVIYVKEEEMVMIAKWIKDIITDFEGNKERVTKEVLALCEKYPIYE